MNDGSGEVKKRITVRSVNYDIEGFLLRAGDSARGVAGRMGVSVNTLANIKKRGTVSFKLLGKMRQSFPFADDFVLSTNVNRKAS